MAAECIDERVDRGVAIRGRDRRAGRSVLPVVIYLLAFVLILLIVSKYYLLPAYDATRVASEAQRRALSTSARLVLAVVLFVLLAGLLLTFRIGRFFRPPEVTRQKPTQYIDAWSESARRLHVEDEPDDKE